jgi:hypothetical protein
MTDTPENKKTKNKPIISPAEYRKMLPTERKAVKILSDNPDMTNSQIGKELKRLGHTKDAGYVMKRLKYSELLRENLSKVRQHNAEVFSRCIVPRAIKEHEAALKDKQMSRKEKFKYVKLALDKEFGADDKRPAPPAMVKVNKVRNLMVQLHQDGDILEANTDIETDTV